MAIYRDGRAVWLREIDAAAYGCGLERVTEGDIWINDQRVTERSRKIAGLRWCSRTTRFIRIERRRKHGVGAENSRHGQAAKAERVKEAARILELDGLLKRPRASYPAVSVSVWRWVARLCRSGGVPV